MPEERWFSVRCIFRRRDDADWAPPELAAGHTVYEERITLWQAASIDEAIALAEAEAAEYERDGSLAYAGLAQAYELFDAPAHGAEVFSLMRDSALGESGYLDRFFDDGNERQQDSDSA